MTLKKMKKNQATFSNFSKDSVFKGIHPWIASVALVLSQGGQPAAMASASVNRCENPNLLLSELRLLTLPFFVFFNSLLRKHWSESFFNVSFVGVPSFLVPDLANSECDLGDMFRDGAGFTQTQPISNCRKLRLTHVVNWFQFDRLIKTKPEWILRGNRLA